MGVSSGVRVGCLFSASDVLMTGPAYLGADSLLSIRHVETVSR